MVHESESNLTLTLTIDIAEKIDNIIKANKQLTTTSLQLKWVVNTSCH